MDIHEIRAAAESESSYLNDQASIRLFVASEANNSRAARLLERCQAAKGKIGPQVEVIRTGSFGCYDLEPLLIIEGPGRSAVLYNNVASDTALDLVNSLLVQEIAAVNPEISDLPLFSLQKRIALRNCGLVDPGNINHYIVRGGGYTGLSRALHGSRDRTRNSILAVLQGRGGPGFSTAGKIQECHAAEGDKYVICNAVAAGPGASAAKLLLESDPHSVLEGILISACAAGASHCIIYVNAGRGLTGSLGKASEQMRRYGLLGRGILGSEFSAEIEVEEVPDSMAAVHRSELLRSIDESQPLPHVRPTYPGIERFAKGTAAIYNPETMAAVSGIFLGGVGETKRTKIVTLSGGVVHTCTAEVPLGTSICSIIDVVGGGTANGKAVKAVQLGGPSGVLIGASEIDLEVGCGISEESHSNIGSGEIRVFSADSEAAGIAGAVMAGLHDQSCGKCLLCFEGSRQISNILSDIGESKGKPQELNLLIELGEAMRAGCGCAFGRGAAEQFQSILRLMRG
jgi:NADH:ubiquinone oxidoreductase subunit F (NADH-binding)